MKEQPLMLQYNFFLDVHVQFREITNVNVFSIDKTRFVAKWVLIHIVEDVSKAFARCGPTLLCVGV